MPQHYVTWNELIASARPISRIINKRMGEDTLDYMHRLAKLGCRLQTISDLSNIPLESVEYWYERNGYS